MSINERTQLLGDLAYDDDQTNDQPTTSRNAQPEIDQSELVGQIDLNCTIEPEVSNDSSSNGSSSSESSTSDSDAEKDSTSESTSSQ